jgi:AraC-like DNA-binding protein
VLEGGYMEAGDCGRFAAEAGHVILHGPYESHQNHFAASGAVVLNIPIRCEAGTLAKVADLDSIVRLAERDQLEASQLLQASLILDDTCCNDWPDQLGKRIIQDPDVQFGAWAEQFDLAPQTLSRGFYKAFGVTPKRFRAEQRTLRALRAIERWQGTGASLAVELGFADQAHMIRSVRKTSGKRPSELRVK